jgi:hypothetical protein
LEEMASLPKLPKPDQSRAELATDFDIPLYNIWKQQERGLAGRCIGAADRNGATGSARWPKFRDLSAGTFVPLPMLLRRVAAGGNLQ